MQRIDVDSTIDTIGQQRLWTLDYAKYGDRTKENRYGSQATLHASHPHHCSTPSVFCRLLDRVAYRLRMGQYAICAAISVNRLLIQFVEWVEPFAKPIASRTKVMGIAEFIIGPAEGRTRWLPPILRDPRYRRVRAKKATTSRSKRSWNAARSKPGLLVQIAGRRAASFAEHGGKKS